MLGGTLGIVDLCPEPNNRADSAQDEEHVHCLKTPQKQAERNGDMRKS